MPAWLIALVSLIVLAAGVAAGAGATQATLPGLLVNYTANCHFTISLDGGVAVPAGSSIPYGQYQLIVTTPFPLSNGQGSCDFINFTFSGPGVNYATQLNQGDGTQDIANETLAASSSYTATDNSVTPGTTIAFSTSSTQVGGASSSSSSSTSTSKSSSSASQSPLGSSLKTIGDLAGTVSSAGKLTLTFKGKGVTSLKAGRYSVTVNDRSSTSGFILQASGEKATTVTSTAFKGKKSMTITLSSGQWLFYPKVGGTKTYFVSVG